MKLGWQPASLSPVTMALDYNATLLAGTSQCCVGGASEWKRMPLAGRIYSVVEATVTSFQLSSGLNWKKIEFTERSL